MEKDRIIDTCDPSNLSEVSRTILADNGKDFDAAIVRGYLSDEDLQELEGVEAAFIRKLKNVPTHPIGRLALTLAENNIVENSDYTHYPFISVKIAGLSPHVDGQLYIGLGMSLRIDDRYDLSRTFLVHNPNIHSLEVADSGIERMNGASMQKLHSLCRSQPLNKIEQGPGDLVIFRNHPYPTIHAVRAEPGSIAALLLSSAIKS